MFLKIYKEINKNAKKEKVKVNIFVEHEKTPNVYKKYFSLNKKEVFSVKNKALKLTSKLKEILVM